MKSILISILWVGLLLVWGGCEKEADPSPNTVEERVKPFLGTWYDAHIYLNNSTYHDYDFTFANSNKLSVSGSAHDLLRVDAWEAYLPKDVETNKVVFEIQSIDWHEGGLLSFPSLAITFKPKLYLSERLDIEHVQLSTFASTIDVNPPKNYQTMNMRHHIEIFLPSDTSQLVTVVPTNLHRY